MHDEMHLRDPFEHFPTRTLSFLGGPEALGVSTSDCGPTDGSSGVGRRATKILDAARDLGGCQVVGKPRFHWLGRLAGTCICEFIWTTGGVPEKRLVPRMYLCRRPSGYGVRSAYLSFCFAPLR